MNKNSLVIYDSGIGGMSVLKKLLIVRPTTKISYIADEEFAPLGLKSFIDIQERCKKVLTLSYQNNNLVLLACNTATVSTIRELQARWVPTFYNGLGKNIIGVSTPLTEFLVEKYWHLRDELGLILATNTTFRTGFYQAEFLKHGFRNFMAVPCTDLALAIEGGVEIEIKKAIEAALEPFKNYINDVKLVSLACTHYHWALDYIKAFFPANTIFIDPTDVVVEKLVKYIDKHKEYKIDSTGDLTFYTTSSDIVNYTNKVKKIFPNNTFDVEQINL